MLSFASAPPAVPVVGRPRAVAAGRAPLGGHALITPASPSGRLCTTAAGASALAERIPASPPSPAAAWGLPLPPAAAAALAQSLPPPPPPLVLLVIADRRGADAATALGAAAAAAAADTGVPLTITPVVAASRVPRPLRPFMYGYLKALGVAAVVDTAGWTEAELGYTPGEVGLALVCRGRLGWQRKAVEDGQGRGGAGVAVDEQVVEVMAAAREAAASTV